MMFWMVGESCDWRYHILDSLWTIRLEFVDVEKVVDLEVFNSGPGADAGLIITQSVGVICKLMDQPDEALLSLLR